MQFLHITSIREPVAAWPWCDLATSQLDLTAYASTVSLPWDYSVGSETPLSKIVYCVAVKKKKNHSLFFFNFKNAAHLVIVNAVVTQTTSLNGISLPTEQPHGGMTIHTNAVSTL